MVKGRNLKARHEAKEYEALVTVPDGIEINKHLFSRARELGGRLKVIGPTDLVLHLVAETKEAAFKERREIVNAMGLRFTREIPDG